MPTPVRKQYMIYTLFVVSQSTRWEAAMGIRTTQGLRKQDSLSVWQSIDTKDEADQWLIGLATALNVPSLPKTVRATRVPLRLGSVIPDKTP